MVEIHNISIPTPFNIGQVNCYLVVEGGQLTLIDPGPMTDEAYKTLRLSINRHDCQITDIDTVLITHAHMDHFGLAHRISEDSGARVLAHADSTYRLENPIQFFEYEQEFFNSFFVSMGLPSDLADTVVGMAESYLDLQEPVIVDRALTDGDVIDAGLDLDVVHTPGHSPGSVCFAVPDEDFAFTGDHVMGGISPNPMLTLAPGTRNERTRSLPEYLTSLQKLRETAITIGYAGHRETVSSLPERIDEIVAHHHERKERIAGIIEDDGPMTAYDIMEDLFPELPPKEIFPGLSEVIGHLDLLEDDERVHIRNVDNVYNYVIP